MEESKKPASAEELLRKILELEQNHANLKQKMSKLMLSGNRPKPDYQTTSSHRDRAGAGVGSSSLWPVNRGTHDGASEHLAMELNETQYWNIAQSMGQAMHIFDLNGRIFYWNKASENLYGFTAEEACGKTPTELLVEDPKDAVLADYILMRTVKGESWSGEFPIRKKSGKFVMIVATNTPYRDENARLIGGLCVSTAVRQYQVTNPGLITGNVASQQPLIKPSIASKISNFASKVKLKMKDYKDEYTEDALENSLTPRGHIAPSPFAVFHSTGTEEEYHTIDSGDENENKLGICKILSSKVEEWIGKRGIVWPWKEKEVEFLDARIGRFGWHRVDINQEHESGLQKSSCAKLDYQPWENTHLVSNKMEGSGLCFSSLHVSSDKSNGIIKMEREMDYEILWEDLITKQQIGQGSCGTVYHALWYGSVSSPSFTPYLLRRPWFKYFEFLFMGTQMLKKFYAIIIDIAVKLFVHQEYSDDVILSFKQEVSLMKRLRHPNILLFMGAVTSPPHLCIVTELLPRGSLFRVLQRNITRLDWKHRLHMAVDIARGMNYLHQCNPPIVHRDLKSSNLLVDKNWTVKVGDFGLSRVKHETYLKTKTGKGTPQWMAPEILRNEQANEKSDVYSYGVVLWEITTAKIPWDNLNPMQVVGAVGFMNRQLEIPKDVDPMWASLIQSCWCSEAESRPTFQEILYKLKDLQKKFAAERRK